MVAKIAPHCSATRTGRLICVQSDLGQSYVSTQTCSSDSVVCIDSYLPRDAEVPDVKPFLHDGLHESTDDE